MELIVAVYDNWGIGAEGTQPIALKADRKFFRETTRGCLVITGRRTVEDFPGQKPLPGRENVLLSRRGEVYPGFTPCTSVEEALKKAAGVPRAMVIGGGSIYRQMLPWCQTAYVTKVHTTLPCDTYFPNLDADPSWYLAETLQSGVEDGISYEMLRYERVKERNLL